MGDLSPHFSRSEFRCKCADQGCIGKTGAVDPELLRILEAMRRALAGPVTIRSGWRCPAHNQAAGGVQDSAHMRGRAADVAAASSPVRFALVKAALAAGAPRVGIGKNIVHVDVDASLPQSVIWLYS
jgi:zinc D-Ala-D-Ala carboxypeptidase